MRGIQWIVIRQILILLCIFYDLHYTAAGLTIWLCLDAVVLQDRLTWMRAAIEINKEMENERLTN